MAPSVMQHLLRLLKPVSTDCSHYLSNIESYNVEFYLHLYHLVISVMNYHVIQSREHIQARIPNIFLGLHELYQY